MKQVIDGETTFDKDGCIFSSCNEYQKALNNAIMNWINMQGEHARILVSASGQLDLRVDCNDDYENWTAFYYKKSRI